MNPIEELEASRMAALSAHRALKRVRDDEIYDAIEEVRERVTSKYQAQTDEASRALAAAESALKDARDARARRGEGALLPIGERYEEWGSKHPYSRGQVKTGRVAVVELWTKDSESSRSAPEIGSTVLRILKKDGSPSKVFEVVRREGEAPFGWRKAQ